MKSLLRSFCLFSALALWVLGPAVFAQANTGVIRGSVSDPSGAVIPGATVSITTPDGHTLASAVSDAGGAYQVRGLAPGTYIVIVTANGFAPSTSKAITVVSGQSKQFDVKLQIQVEKQQVVVNEDNPTVSIDPSSNANTLVLKGKDLDALSDDPDELQNELNALAGPAAGPNGGQIYIDGFTAGQLPPKSAIREIRINQNPFSAEYDKLGYGRIEILTKPGTDKFHGQFFVQGNASQFNTGNPFTSNIPDYHSYQFNGTVNGPISKTASFFVSAERRNIEDAAIVSAYRLVGEINGDFANGIYTNPADYNTAPFSDSLLTPRTRTNISPRVDWQLGERNTLSVRYQYYGNSNQNQGVGQFSLNNQAYSSNSSEHTVQISDTQVINDKIINETRFQFLRDYSSQSPFATTPQVQVSGTETFGGNSEQIINDHSLHFELQNLTEMALKKHAINFGGRLRVARDANTANSSFNGIFTFGGHQCTTTSPSCVSTDAATAYGNTIYGQGIGQTWEQIQAAGGGPSQLNVTFGEPSTTVNLTDVGLFYQDDWKARQNLTISYGVRWESQSDIGDKNDWAPRFSFAYALGAKNKPAKTVIRGGYGFFYDRFPLSGVLQATRQSDLPNSPQKEVVIQNPTCYLPNGITSGDLIACSGAGSTSSKTAVYQIQPNLHAALTEQAAVGVERQVTKTSTVSFTYLNSLGRHQFITRNANAPYSPVYDPTGPNIYQYFSEAEFQQNQIITNFNARFTPNLSIFGFYTLSWANSDTGGINSNPSNSQNLKADYGRASFDTRNQMFLMASWSTRWGLRFNPFIVLASGRPFNITVGQDLNGDSFFNDRPSYAQPGDTDVIDTSYGNFNVNPSANETRVPINLGDGPNLFTFNLRATKSIGFGPKVEGHGPGVFMGGGGGRGPGGPGGGLGPRGLSGGGGGPGRPGGQSGVNHRYNLNFSVQALNLFNDINLAPPTGTLGTPNFGKSNAMAGQIYSSGSASRRIFLQAIFTF
ncbi:MAG TPA: carboxypeptidase regulatory-like domain-containing protein [Silvibacterium sp.]|nr:carboxypeptidase regulatory-like domain-containing protein [Silvibacterium sp.]